MALERYLAGFGEEIESLAGLDVGRMWDRLLGEFLNEWARLDRQQLPRAEMTRELEAFMRGLSDRVETDLARGSTTVAYNQGRNAEILTAEDEGTADFVVRSEILDSNTCPPCAALDGAVVEIGSADYFNLMPPAQCDGRDRCRGFYIAVPEGI